MFSRQNRNRPSGGRAIGFVIAFLVVVYIASRRGGERAAPPEPSPAPAARVTQSPAVNPLDRMLKVRDAVDPKEGVAAAILVDTSGSMGEKVADAGGKQSPKIQIAQRAVLKLIEQSAGFAKAHPEHNVQVGVYEFSGRDRQSPSRQVIPLGTPDPAKAQAALNRMSPNGATPIGDAIIAAKRDLDAAGYRRMHILVVTDGENTRGYAPADVVGAIGRLDEPHRASVYFIAFDVAAEKFNAVRDAGGLVLPASNEAELQQTLDYVLTGKILAEQPLVPGP